MIVGVITTSPRGQVPGGSSTPTPEIMARAGLNLGNLAFWGAVSSHIADHIEYLPWNFDPHSYRDRVDVVVFPAANQIGSHSDLGDLQKRLEKMARPVVVVGLGTQFLQDVSEIQLTPGTRRFLHWLNDIGARLGLRGNVTAEILTDLGFDNFEVMGCPSFFINLQRDQGKSIAARLSAPIQSFAVCQGEFSDIGQQIERKLVKQVLGSSNSTYICQAPADLVHLGLGRNLPEPRLQRLSGFLGFNRHEVHRLAKQSLAFLQFDSWMDHLTGKDLVVGARLHGNILALQSGVPGVVIQTDGRMTELVNTGMLPTITVDYRDWDSMETLREQVVFCGSSYDQRRGDLARTYVQLLKAGGITVESKLLRFSQSMTGFIPSIHI